MTRDARVNDELLEARTYRLFNLADEVVLDQNQEPVEFTRLRVAYLMMLALRAAYTKCLETGEIYPHV